MQWNTLRYSCCAVSYALIGPVIDYMTIFGAWWTFVLKFVVIKSFEAQSGVPQPMRLSSLLAQVPVSNPLWCLFSISLSNEVIVRSRWDLNSLHWVF